MNNNVISILKGMGFLGTLLTVDEKEIQLNIPSVPLTRPSEMHEFCP